MITRIINVVLARVIWVVCLTAAIFGLSHGNALSETPAYSGKYLFALIGNVNTPDQLLTVHRAGVEAKILRLSWRDYMPRQEGLVNDTYVLQKKAEIAEMRRAGIQIIVDLGLHDAPTWVHLYPNSFYINQYGQVYYPSGIDNGDVNLVFNLELRRVAAAYIDTVFADLGNDFFAVRLGGGHWGELTYPHHTYQNSTNCYWAFDANAQSHSPAPGWRPGDPSPNHEAEKFFNWYLDALVDYQNWQIIQARAHFAGWLMMLYPSWGIRPGQVDEAIEVNLNGSTSAERNGETQRGFDFARQIKAITDPKVVVTSTWLDAPADGDSSWNPKQWSPVKYLSSLADEHEPKLAKFGENTGKGDLQRMQLSAFQMQRNKLMGMAWYREEEMLSGSYAGLNEYERTIRFYNESK